MAAPSAELSLTDLTDAQRHELGAKAKDESMENQPLLSEALELSVLAKEYENGDASFQRKLRWLRYKAEFIGYFKTRGDGDCFYRAFGFAYILRIIHMNDRPLHHFVTQHLDTTRQLLEKAGFDKDVFTDFWEPFRGLLSRIHSTDPQVMELTDDELVEAFNDPETSNSVVVYLRLVASAFLKVNADEFAPFLFATEGASGSSDEAPTMADFCANQVEAIGKEADHLAITALSRALLVSLEVVYFNRSPMPGSPAALEAAAAKPPITIQMPGADRGSAQQVDQEPCDVVRFEMPTEPGAAVGTSGGVASTQVALLDIGGLLFRPGHYDVLIKAPRLQNTPSPVIPKAPGPWALR